MNFDETYLKRFSWRFIGCATSGMVLWLALALIESARAEAPIFNITMPPDTTVLYFNSADELLWVERFSIVTNRTIIPVSAPDLIAKIPFTTIPKPKNHFDCSTCPEKRADLVTSSVAATAVYCGRSGAESDEGLASPIVVEDLSKVGSRLIELAPSGDPTPCPFPKKCHCTGGSCCCW